MNVPLHDTHFHLDLFKDPVITLASIEQAQVYTIAVTNVPEVFFHTQHLVSGSKYVRAAIGFHPELAFEHQQQLPLFMDILPNTKYVGEVGLDNYNKSQEDFTVQKKIFTQIVSACSMQPGKILTVHSRRAEKDVLNIFGDGFPGKVILHWFSGPLKELERALALGFYFSINYAMTQSENGKRIIIRLSPDKILLETDGPFVKYGNIPSTPQMTGEILKNILAIKKAQYPDLLPIDIYNNFKALIS